MGQPMQRTGECHSCGECCKTVNITVVRDITIQQHGSLEELELYLSYRGIRVVGSDEKRNQLYYSVDVPCSELTTDNQCRVHDSPMKPLICLRFPSTKEDVEEIPNCGYSFPTGLGQRRLRFKVSMGSCFAEKSLRNRYLVRAGFRQKWLRYGFPLFIGRWPDPSRFLHTRSCHAVFQRDEKSDSYIFHQNRSLGP